MAHPIVRVDASNYTSIPRINARSGVALVRAVLVALPKGAPDRVKLAARALRADAVTLQEANHAASAAAAALPEPRNSRVIDNDADALHGAVKRRLADHTLLTELDPEVAASVASLSRVLYPEELEFTQGDMMTQWQGTEEWYTRVRADNREQALRAAVGDAFVDAIARVHAEYGVAVGTTKAQRPEPPKVDIATPLAAVSLGLQEVALQLVSLANDRSASDDLRAAARDALSPIDRHRAGNARRGAARATPAEPAPEPAPEPKPEVKGEAKGEPKPVGGDGDEPLPEV